MDKTNSTQRFSDRVDDYVKFRPSYPPSLIEFLQANAALNPQAAVADVASGTGILTYLLLKTGAQVFGVEPNLAMREAAEKYLRGQSRFTSVNGSAETTGLPDRSVDLITVAQAFHWFDPERARGESLRILKKGGWAGLIWNSSKTTATPFAQEYERLRRTYATSDFKDLSHYASLAAIDLYFGGRKWRREVFDNFQELDAPGLLGRYFSASYSPKADSPQRKIVSEELLSAFARFNKGGVVRMEYETEIYLGQLT